MEQVFTIKNPAGIHARPASILVKKASTFPCEITLIKDGKRVNAKSIMGVMSLAIRQGDEIAVETEGEQAESALQEIGEILTNVHE